MYLGSRDREQSLQNGTLFDDFTIRMNNIRTGRRKQVIDTRAEGLFITHTCLNCKFGNNVPRNLLRIAHFRKSVPFNDSIELSCTLLKYTNDLKFILSKLN